MSKLSTEMAREVFHPQGKSYPGVLQVQKGSRCSEVPEENRGPTGMHQPRDWPGVQEIPAHNESGDVQADFLLRGT